jgi:WD40 repeat protein/tetratricopeptide (TPR) repeat protein
MELKLAEKVTEKLIRGEITEVSMAELKRMLPKKNLMVFVSSTFLDSNLERDILHKKILPELQKKAQLHEIQIVFYDMRFGVKDENTLDHMTWETCKEAIRQCHEGSDGLFFLSLQADRYGYQALPKYLDQAILSKARKDHENDSNFTEIAKFLDEWYKLDENYCPPRYELKRLAKLKDPEFEKAVPILKDCLLDSVPFENLKILPEKIVVNRSVTQWETFYGLDCGKERCYWIQRVFGKASLRSFKDNSDCWKVTDLFSVENTLNGCSTATKLELFHEKMKTYLQDHQRVELSTHCSPEAYLKGEGCEEYLEVWERVTRDCLEKELKKVIDKSEQWNDGFAGIPADQLEEIVHHCSTAFTKASNFFGREELLGKALEMIKKATDPIKRGGDAESKPLSGICMAIVGKSGCGKTALMSKLALSLGSGGATAVKEIPVIIRFCGTSRYSLNGLQLIQSICLQILAVYQKREELKELISVLPSQEYKTAVKYFQKLVSQYPIYLLIDSLDQLENRYEERSKLTFLRNLKPLDQSRIIVSTLPDEYDKKGKIGKYYYQCERTLRTGSVPIKEVKVIHAAYSTMSSLLTSRQRKLTNTQWIVTLHAVSHEPTILYINLAMEVISQWRSFDKNVILRPTVKGLIHQIFGDLEVSFGKEFTSIAFAMITFSREGVNDPELQDLLSLHEGVMTEVCQYSKLHCFPMHAWLRLKQVVKNLVIEKENHCIKWYHRQLWETASERYSEKEKECHEIMGKYFANLVDIDMKKEKDIMSQPLILNEVSVWISESIVNRRRVAEGYYHLIKGGLLQEAVEEVCSLEFVCCSALAGDLLSCVRSLGELVRLFGSDNDIAQRLDHYYRWMRKKATRILTDPRRQTKMTAGEEPLISVVKNQISQLEVNGRTEVGPSLEPTTFGSVEDFDALEMELTGHIDKLLSVSWSHDDSKILSGSYDSTIKVWDGTTGELLNTLEGHSNGVISASWNHDSSKIVSGSKDGTIKIWDGINYEFLMTVMSGTSYVNSVSWNHDGTKIASAANRGMIKLWDAISGKLLQQLTMVRNMDIRCVSWNHDSSRLISGSWDGKITIWNVFTGKLLRMLNSHSGAVTSAFWNRYSTLIVSASYDNTIKIWDGFTGTLIKTLEGHSDKVHSAIWNHDSTKILSGSWDNTIKIWNTRTGELEETVAYIENDSLAWNHDGSKIVSGSRNGPVRVFKVWGQGTKNSGSRLACMSEWNPADGERLVTGSDDGTIQIWNGKTGEMLRKVKGHSVEVRSVPWNHDGSKIASGSRDKTIKIWDGATCELLKTLEGHSDTTRELCWNHDSSKIISASNCEFLLWDVTAGENVAKVKNDFQSVIAMFWNHDDSKLLIGNWQPGNATIWNGVTLTQVRQLCKCDRLNSVSWNHDCSKVVTSLGDKVIQVFDVESGSLLNTLRGHSDWVWSLTWNRDGTKIFSGSDDGTFRIWDGISGQLLKIESFGCAVCAIRLTNAEDQIAFRSKDRFVRCLTLPDNKEK